MSFRQDAEDSVVLDPIDRFGIVAAMARNRVMGVNGKLPWNLPTDRKHFVHLTKNKVLIMGRRTFEEEPSRTHISHAAHNIVVSTTLDQSTTDVQVARSFPEALHLAKMQTEKGQRDEETIECWVVGGERIYNEALKHPSAKELHLTLVDIDVDISALEKGPQGVNPHVALFPAKYRWDRNYNEISQSSHETTNPDGTLYRYTHTVYKRKKQQK